MAEILFTFNKNGTVKVEPQGYGGDLCKTVTAPYELAIGGQGPSVPTAEAAMAPLQAKGPEETIKIGQ